MSIVWVPSVNDTKDVGINSAVDQNGSDADSPQKLDQELLCVPLSNKEGLTSILSTISMTFQTSTSHKEIVERTSS